MSPRPTPTAVGSTPALRLVPGGRDLAAPSPTRGPARPELRLLTRPTRERASPFESYLQAPRRSHTPRWILAGALACWLVLGWTLVAGVLQPIGHGVVHEGTRSLFLALARGLPVPGAGLAFRP